MALVSYFDQLPSIRLYDGLAQLLGSSDDGIIEYRYSDAVRLAGHSCPTVAGAWLMSRAGLEALYGDDMPQRGAVSVFMPSNESEGVTGVIAQVFTLVTGAAADNGFKGLAGQHRRAGLLSYDQRAIDGIRMQRNDSGRTVELGYDPSIVHGSPEASGLLGFILGGQASTEQKQRFGQLWQDRVQRILQDHHDDPDVVQVRVVDDGR